MLFLQCSKTHCQLARCLNTGAVSHFEDTEGNLQEISNTSQCQKCSYLEQQVVDLKKEIASMSANHMVELERLNVKINKTKIAREKCAAELKVSEKQLKQEELKQKLIEASKNYFPTDDTNFPNVRFI